MKNLEEFYNEYITEMARPKGSKNKPKDDAFSENPKELEKDPRIADAVDAKDVKPQDVKANKAKGVWDVDSPLEGWEGELAKLNVDDLDDNAYELSERFDDKHDFLVLGEAGWAKTSIIEAMAKKHGYHVITVYLDKAVATDLGGIPVPSKTDNNELFMDYSIPGWALEMLQHPKNKYLLFFDEMNQAAPDVLNALMPIVLKHVVCGINFGDQFIVGAAGNLAHENESLSELNKPLRDRFKPIIEWEVHTEDSWKAAFEYLHSEFDKEIGADIINELQKHCEIWNSPRDLTRVLLEFVKANKSRDRKYSRARSIKKKLMACVWDEANTEARKFESDIDKLADYISQYVQGTLNKDTGNGGSRSQAKGMDQVNPEDKEAIIKALRQGFFYYSEQNGGNNTNYLATVENILGDEEDPDDHSLFGMKTTGITREVLEMIIREMEAEGRGPKFQTIEEGRKMAEDKGWEIAWAHAGVLVKHHLKAESDEPAPRKQETPKSRD